MPYYTKVLQPDENVRVIGRLHWSVYVRGLIVIVLACGVAVLALSGRLPNPDWQRYVGIAIRRRATEIVVTDRRVIFKRGLLTRHTVEMNVSKIETVDVEQGIGGRMWNYGTLMIRGTGAGFEPLVGVGSPIVIRNAIVAG